MEFPAGTLINLKVIDDFTNLCCKLYCTTPPRTPAPGPAFENDLLCHSVDLEVAALTLRNSGHLVSTAPNGYGLWIFSSEEGFDTLTVSSLSSDGGSCNVIEVGDLTFRCCASGTVSISEVAKRNVAEPNSTLLQESILQAHANDGTIPDVVLQRMATYSNIYAAFVSALSGVLIQNAIRNHSAIPLGKRTLFFATGFDSYEDRDIEALVTASATFISTLDIEFTARGRPIVSWKYTPQPGLERLPGHTTSCLPLNEDLWLAPTATICRYVSTIESQATSVSPKVQRWKEVLSLLFQRMCLDLHEFQESAWIEVEVLNPESHHGVGIHVVDDDSDEPSPTSRILWPAAYCFRRAKSEYNNNVHGPECFQADFEHPLNFAERWMADSVGRRAPITSGKSGQQPEVEREEPQSKVATPNAPRGALLETIESLARTINNPDSNVFQGVYPTPPGGSMAPNVSVTAAEGLDPVANYVLNAAGGEQTAYQPEDIPSASLHGDLDVPSQLGVGSGMYDTTAEDDLFGDMGDDFGGKGITEADFNFFDEPDFAALKDTTMQQDAPDSMLEGQAATPHKTSLPVGPTLGDGPDPGDLYMADLSDTAPHDDGGYGSTLSGVEGDDVGGAPSKTSDQAESRPISPPLSPARVKNILLAQGTASLGSPVGQNQALRNQYGAIPFKETLSSSDQKYGQSGRFWFNPGQDKEQGETEPRRNFTDIPLIGHPSRIHMEHGEPSRPYAELTIADDIDSGVQSPFDSSERSTDDESQFSISVPDETTPPLYQTDSRRKQSVLGTSKPGTPAIPLDTQDVDDGPTPARCSSLVGSLISRATDWSFAGYFSKKQSELAPVLYEASELTLVAQLVADQVTQSSFPQRIDGVVDYSDPVTDNPHIFTEGPDLLDIGQQVDLAEYSEIDGTSDGTGKRKDGQSKSSISPGITKLEPPYVRLRRGDRYLETLPPAVPFWEIFGLEPLLGQKDIIAYCIYPQNTKDDADSFLERLGSTYSAASFGKHSRSGSDNGLVPWVPGPNGERDYASLISSLLDTCENLGTALSDLPQSDENIVLYVLNPFHHGPALADICTAFLRLFHKYIEATSKRHVRLSHELVLQVVPLEFVASPDSLVAAPQADYLHLSLEVYSRCAPTNPNIDDIACAPPVTLAEPVPKTVPFKLSSDAPSPLENSRCFHIAYSHSLDGRWITVAWTDSAGRQQTSMSYCLRERGASVSRSIVEVLADVWGATQDILGMAQRQWQLMVAKDGSMDPEEVTAWTIFAQKQNQVKPAKVELTLLSVNTSPGLFLKIPPSQPQLSAFSQQVPRPSQGSLTPAATPKPGVPSPEPSSNASTPYPTTYLHTPNEQQQQQQQQQQPSHQQQQQPQTPQHPPTDPSQDQPTLIDKSDETWSLILPYNLNTSPSLSTYRPAHASGHLLRRRNGTSDTESLASLTVNVIHYPSSSRSSAGSILRDVLRMYRDLATLSRTRGLVNARGDCPLPWHIATAVRGQEALSHIL